MRIHRFRSIVLDTETSGLPDYDKAAESPTQPDLAEIGLIFLDEELRVERRYQCYIRPDGWTMQPGATEANGLTTEFLLEHGVPVTEALDVYAAAILEGRAVIAFGAQFDCKVMRTALHRAGRDKLFEQTANICVMRSLMSHAKQMKLVHGRMLYKYADNGDVLLTKKGEPAGGMPKLSDALRYYNLPLPERAHSALVDAESTEKIYRAMVAEGFDREPEVHHSKNHEAIRSNL